MTEPQPLSTDPVVPTSTPASAPSETTPPAAVASAPAPAQNPPPPTDRPGGPRERRDNIDRLRRKDKRDRPNRDGPSEPVRSLEEELALRSNASARLREVDAEIEAELAEALSGFANKDVFGEPEKRGKPTTGDLGKKKGKVISVHGPDVFIDVPGGRVQGVLPLLQFPEGVPERGLEVDIQIEGYDNANGLLLLTRRGAAMVADWSSVAEGMLVEARVLEVNKGGLTVDVNGIRAFMPMGQIDIYRVEKPETFVNQRLRCLVTDVQPEERNLVVSRRAVLQQEREEAKEKTWAELSEGQIRQGIVSRVQPFGAFVDIGGVDGLVHVSEMSWARVHDATTVVQQGQSVRVTVLRIDREKRKIALGMKQLEPSPWDNVLDKYAPGAVVLGKVSRIEPFGAFVELEPAIEGLVHISELAPQRVSRVSAVVQIDQEVKVLVLDVNATARRIALSLKQAMPKEPEKVEEEVEDEVIEPVKPSKPRTTPLRGGVGGSSGPGLGIQL